MFLCQTKFILNTLDSVVDHIHSAISALLQLLILKWNSFLPLTTALSVLSVPGDDSASSKANIGKPFTISGDIKWG